MIRLCLWKIWKWILHLVTGKCELFRIAESQIPVHHKTADVVASLKLSKNNDLQMIVKDLGVKMDLDTSIAIIIEQKAIKPHLQSGFEDAVRPCLLRLSGVHKLFMAVETMRSEKYRQTQQDHEDMLMQLWENLMVGCQLTERISKQWQDIGFQGNNPATDFRGMGLLGLKSLLYFSVEHSDKARTAVLHSRHPKYWYPFAVVGIDLTGVIYDWLKQGDLDAYLYSTCSEWPPSLDVFMEIFSFVLWQFDSYWISRQPENIMLFPAIKLAFLKQLKLKITGGTVVLAIDKV